MCKRDFKVPLSHAKISYRKQWLRHMLNPPALQVRSLIATQGPISHSGEGGKVYTEIISLGKISGGGKISAPLSQRSQLPHAHLNVQAHAPCLEAERFANQIASNISQHLE